MTFNDFFHKYNLQKKASSSIKRFEVLKKIGLDSRLSIHLRDGNFSSNYGILNLHHSKVTLWVCYFKDCYFDLYGCPPLKKILNYVKNRHRKCIYFYSEYQIQRNDCFCAR